jgi:hypothetical protein
MAEVVFIFPRTLWDIKNVTTRLPMSVLYMGTVLQEWGFSVQVIDQRVDEGWERTLRRALRERPLWVGISSMTGQQIRWGLEAARMVRRVDAAIPIVWGGVHPTILPKQTLAHPLVDAVAVGEGEITDDEVSSFGGYGVVRIPGLQLLLAHICAHGYEHHVAMNPDSVADAVDKAFSRYLGWDVYRHLV